MNNGLGEPVREKIDFAQKLGFISALMALHPKYRTYPIVCLQAWIMPALAHDQARIFFDEKGGAVGYITWGYLGLDVADRWIKDPNVLLHFSEWNEGGELWIMDFFAVPGFAKIILNEIRKNMFGDEEFAKSYRRARAATGARPTRWRH